MAGKIKDALRNIGFGSFGGTRLVRADVRLDLLGNKVIVRVEETGNGVKFAVQPTLTIIRKPIEEKRGEAEPVEPVNVQAEQPADKRRSRFCD